MGTANGDIHIFFYDADKKFIERVRGAMDGNKVTAKAPPGARFFSFTGDVKLHKLNINEAEYEPFRMEIRKDG